MKPSIARILALAIVALAFGANALAQQPTVRLVVPYGSGGAPDVLARTLASKLSERLAQPVIVDNRPGGSGLIAAQLVKQAPPDGQTLFVADTGHWAINVALRPDLPYDPLKDFTPVTQAVSTPLFLAVNSDLPVKNVAELVALANSRPGGLLYGSSGNGSPHHLALAQIQTLTKANMQHVPYKGVAQSVPALIAGDIAVCFYGLPSIMPHVKSGKARIIGVTERTQLVPEAIAVADQVPGFNVGVTIGLLAPARTPAEIARKLSSEIAAVLSMPDVEERLRTLGIDKVASTPEQFREVIGADIARFTKIVKETGAKVE